MADENLQGTAQQATGADATATGRLVRKLLGKSDTAQASSPPQQGVAHVPATLLTVEYVDDSEGMDAALRDMDGRLQKVEESVDTMQRTQSQLIAAVNQQAKDIAKCVEAIGRRIDKLYKRVSGGEITGYRKAGQVEDASVEEVRIEAQQPTAQMPVEGPAPEVADDPAHQNAWRVARVLVADLEGYHEDAVREGVLYGTFYKLLREPIEKARKTYEERVEPQIVENYDYFSRALDELIVRKRMELEDEGAL